MEDLGELAFERSIIGCPFAGTGGVANPCQKHLRVKRT